MTEKKVKINQKQSVSIRRQRRARSTKTLPLGLSSGGGGRLCLWSSKSRGGSIIFSFAFLVKARKGSRFFVLSCFLSALSVDDCRARLVILGLANPHLIERRER